MSEVKLIIPRQPYGNLQRPGAGRIGDVRLSPEGMAALDRLTTCSRGAVLDLAVRLLDGLTNGDDLMLRNVLADVGMVAECETDLRRFADRFLMTGWMLKGVLGDQP